MKKIFKMAVVAVAAGCTFAACDKDEEQEKNDVPSSWTSAKFGTVSCATTQTWTVGSQIWTDAVQTSYGSSKTTFDGNTADSRSNPRQKGDLFSWYAIDSFKNQLCPEGWRVPTKQDFIDLDIALGGTGNESYHNTTHRNKYLNTWGGAYGSGCGSGGLLDGQGLSADYWSQSENDSDFGFGLRFNSNGNVYPQNDDYFKDSGLALRCVQDKK